MMATGAAVIVTSEDDSTEIHSRLATLGQIPPRLYVVSLPDAGGVRPLFRTERSGEVIATPAWEDLARQLDEIDTLKLVVLDPLQPLAAYDLNTAEAAQAVCSRLAALASRIGAAVIVSHHFTKAREIETPAQAREAVRGSGGLIDGVRAAYALWPARPDAVKRIARALGERMEPEQVVLGAVVKSNGPSSRDIRTFIRSETGLLIDRTQELRDLTPTQRDHLPELKAAIAQAAKEGKPYTRTGIQGVYARRFELPEELQGISRARLEGWADNLLEAGEIVQAACAGAGVKWLDIPSGDVARGDAKFATGHVQRSQGSRSRAFGAAETGAENAPL